MIFKILRSGHSPVEIFLSIVAFVCAIVIAITVHEFAHGFIAKKNGDPTADFYGRLTLNPIKHFDPIGFILLLVAGFGFAKPVPINPNNFRNQKKGLITVSLAGVVANLILAIISTILIIIVLILKNKLPESDIVNIIITLFGSFFGYSIIINLALMAFNLLPIYPLDGFNLLAVFLKPNNKYLLFMKQYGFIVLMVLVLGGSFLSQISIFLDPLGLYLKAVQFIANAIINFFVGLFI